MAHDHQAACAYIRSKLDLDPEIGLILGSGLGGLAQEISDPVYIPYADIPDFAVSTAPGHAGRFVAGKLGGKNVLCMQGRLHFYEGHPFSDVTFPVRVMKKLGIRALIITNASGGINQEFEVGDFMLIDDHINLMGSNPLIGPNDDAFGPRFCDMTYAYAPELKQIALDAAKECGIPLKRGVYLGCTGPSFETPAEIRAFRTLGADAVGMSTVPEVIVASHCALPVLAISMITNMAAGILAQKLDGQDVIDTADRRAKVLQRLVSQIVEKM